MQEVDSVVRDFALGGLPSIPPVTQATNQHGGIDESETLLGRSLEDDFNAMYEAIQTKGKTVLREHMAVVHARQDFENALKQLRYGAAEYDSRQHVLAESQNVYMNEIAKLSASAPTPLPGTTTLAQHHAEVLHHYEVLAENTEEWQSIEAEVTRIATRLASREQSFLDSVERMVSSTPRPTEEVWQSKGSACLDSVSEAYADCIGDLDCKLAWLVELFVDYATWSDRHNDDMVQDIAGRIGSAQTEVIRAVDAADCALYAAEEADVSMHEFWYSHQVKLFEILSAVTQQDILHPTSVKLDSLGTPTISPPAMSQASQVPRFDLHNLATIIRERQALRSISV
ncbi:hypothetical protein LTR10_010616 [Elasticomyces elasticus]|nr:hypothetical protein LTR10_010616 [Elasticomyces elasticus]KAK4968222.1 hypothetical protein LTR42_009505 [Elasticomyces elasticus]